ncbi:hypothetical protein B6U74_07430 [Candidatus Bathyarchaeota archaeon ex4484_205]|nr:MAG: hypothetical protein B6U74_07430 [Candidatus Bathyarchaeota archaeon ex4484_205]
MPELLPQASTTHTYDFKVTKTGTITIPPAKVTYYDEEGRLYEESSSGATVTVVGTPALEVTHSVNPPEAKVGEEVEVSITITNTGDGTADNVRVTFTPPMELEPKEGQPTTVTLGRITPGQKKMPKFYLIANESGEITIPGDSIVIEYSRKDLQLHLQKKLLEFQLLGEHRRPHSEQDQGRGVFQAELGREVFPRERSKTFLPSHYFSYV